MQVGGLDFGDFDNDFDLDLAVGCYHSQSYPPYNDWRNFVLTNNDGQFEESPSWWSSDSRSTTDIKWADFNSDEWLDLFACNGDFSQDPNVIYFGSPGGLATTPGWLATDATFTTGGDPCDFDHDGDIDMATSNQGVYPNYNRPIYIYNNAGTGLNPTPGWQSSDQMISSFLKWGDLDNDGYEELAVSKWVNFESCVYKNNNGTMQTDPYWTCGSTRSDKGIGWGDIDNDSFPELAIGGTEPTWLFDNVEGILGVTPIWQSNNSYHGCQDLAWCDVDSDGDPDLATVEFSTGHLRIYLNIDGELSTTPSWQYDGNGMGTALAFGDINGDSFPDLAMGQSGQPSVLTFLSTLTASIEENSPTPQSFDLSQNYPNPFNSSTGFELLLKQSARVNAAIFDILGKRIDTIADNIFPAGKSQIFWHPQNQPSGLYFCRAMIGNESAAIRLILLK